MTFLAAMLLAMVPQQGLSQDEIPQPTFPLPPNPCDEAPFRQFDFWVGQWDVYLTGTDTQVATSLVERVSNGCAVRETWMPLRGAPGTSLSTFEPVDGLWHQLWVGPQPGQVFFSGGMSGTEMVITGYWGVNAEGQPNLVRMTYTPNADGSVRQHGDASGDHGVTWEPNFDLTYRPHGG
ncbi:MAG: hypothetical protein KDE15_13295 [Erythrobacter sp.]|nr:hypothetical protein [Erythrobacter sp.]